MTHYTQSYLLDPDSSPPFPSSYYNYSLKGVVIHMGTSDSGHYYSLIKDTSKKQPEWFEFNDTLIKKFDINELPFEAFGGEDKSMMEYSQSIREKSHNAYLLFYERNKIYDENCEEIDSLLSNNEFTSENSDSLEFIKADNLKYHINKILLDHGFELFFYEMGIEFLKLPEFTRNSFELSKMILYNFLIVGLRVKDRDKLPKNLKLVKELLSKSYELSNWLISQISFVEILKEFLIDCCIDDMKYVFSGVLRVAIMKISDQDEEMNYEDFKGKSSLKGFIANCLALLFEIKPSLDHIFRILHFLTRKSENCRKFMKEMKIFEVFKEFVMEEPLSKLVSYENLNDFLMKCELKPIMINTKNKTNNTNSLQKVSLEKFIKDYSYFVLVCCDVVLNEIYERNELEVFAKNEDFLKKLMKLSKRKIVFGGVAKMMSFLAKENEQFSMFLMEILFGDLGICEENDMKIYWIICEELLKIQDLFTEKRVSFFNKIKDFFDIFCLDWSVYREIYEFFREKSPVLQNMRNYLHLLDKGKKFLRFLMIFFLDHCKE